jgi:hypothetical protein
MTVLATSFGNGDVLLWMLEFFLFVIWFWLLLSIFGDLFRDHELSGGLKAVWIFVLVLFPYIGIFVYLIARGKGMAGRAAAQQQLVQQQVDAHIRATAAGAAGATSATDQIAQAKSLLDSGAIDQAEYDALKARALTA